MTLPPDPLDQDMPDNAPEDVPEEALGDGDFHAYEHGFDAAQCGGENPGEHAAIFRRGPDRRQCRAFDTSGV